MSGDKTDTPNLDAWLDRSHPEWGLLYFEGNVSILHRRCDDDGLDHRGEPATWALYGSATNYEHAKAMLWALRGAA